MVKKIWNDISSNIRQIIETMALVVVVLIMLNIDAQGIFQSYLAGNTPTPDNFIWYMAISRGKYEVAVIAFFALLIWFRKFNSEFMMNQKNVYHNYSYGWYWFCAKILGIKKCNLILVPIYTQFRLVIRGTFEYYPLNENEYPIIENEPDCKVEIINDGADKHVINLIFEDTYQVEYKQIPKDKRNLYTVKISRNDGEDTGRHFSQKLVESAINEMRKIQTNIDVNVYATTNPMNTLHISRRVFALGDRGNIKSLYVFQQENTDKRRFNSKGYKIY